MQKSYSSQTKDDKYYQGEETDFQRTGRKRLSKTIAGLGVISGGGLGSAMADSKVNDAINRVNHSYYMEGRMRDAYANSLNPNTRLNILREKCKDEANSLVANINYNSRMLKLGRKAKIRGALKGAAVGGAIGGLTAYAYNNSAKTQNEKTNAKRRKRK